jgi:eukaryotic-like serine/threonine-protein kinase
LTSNSHQRAKEIFLQVVELPKNQQPPKLLELCGDDDGLYREVSSLLDFHTARSLVAQPATPKIRTRSTLSTTRMDKPWYRKLIRFLPALLPVAITLFLLLPLLIYISDAMLQRDRFIATERLEYVADARSTMLQRWNEQTQFTVQRMIASQRFQSLVKKFLIGDPGDQNPDSSGKESGSSEQLAAKDAPWQPTIEASLGVQAAFMLWDRKLNLVACTKTGQDVTVGGQIPMRGNDIRRALGGELIIKMPDPSRMELPAIFNSSSISIFCPVKSESGGVQAIVLIQSNEFDESFRELIHKWNSDDSTNIESYLVDSQGHLLSKNRNPDHLSRLKQILAQGGGEGPKESSSSQTEGLLIRDPGVDLIAGGVPGTRAANWSLTQAAKELTHQSDGWNAEGYRNYVGQMVVGAWRWLPGSNVGLIFETPQFNAYHFSRTIRWLLYSVFAICMVGSLAGVYANWPKRRPNQLQTVGPYKIQELLGQGGMGAVYLAEHSLLCRPTAIKILTKEKAELSVLIRFEREVQLASQLTHPNTIAIYDFGRNEDGVFYYAMEYIDGGHIGELVEFEGPLPAGRCIYLVRQLCFALREAHLAGVVHRDIKPQNVMVCDRGGEPDFIKLVDYGLVKAFAPGITEGLSQTKIVMGTPRFMAPERLQSPWLADPRVDIYSIGGLLYFMLTSELPPLVAPTGSSDHVQLGVETMDLQPTAVPFSDLLSHCMSYDPATRPSSIASLLTELEELAVRIPWTRDDSEAWWKKRGAKFKQFLANKRKMKKP